MMKEHVEEGRVKETNLITFYKIIIYNSTGNTARW